MTISKEAIRYILLTQKTCDSCIEVENIDGIISQPPWRHSKTIFVEINDTVVEAQYQFAGHPVCIQRNDKFCVSFPEGVLAEDTFYADIKMDPEDSQKYLRTAHDFYKVWETDPRIATETDNDAVVVSTEVLEDPAEAGWGGSCIIC